MATYTNKVVRISLSGGLIGLLATDPRRAIEDAVSRENAEGYHCHQIVPHSSRNLLVILLQILVLMLTLGLWTWTGGYILLFAKER
jgi:hypothetical protein